MSMFSRIAARIGKYPVLIAATQSGTLMCTGDLISQTVVEKKKVSEIDLIRTARFGAVGFIVVGPLLSKWYGFLERKIVLKNPMISGFTKMATDQLILAPSFLFCFMGLMGTLNGQSLPMIKADIRNNYGDIMLRNYQLWPAAQMINFSLIPPPHRVLFAQSVALLWNVYLSYKTNRTESDAQGLIEGKDANNASEHVSLAL